MVRNSAIGGTPGGIIRCNCPAIAGSWGTAVIPLEQWATHWAETMR